MSTKTHTSFTRLKYDDCIDVNNQTVEIDPVEHIRRCTLYKDIDIWSYYKSIYPNVRTLGDVLDHGQTLSKDGPCIGLVQSENKAEPIRWLSYSTVSERARYIGSYLWTETKLVPMNSKVAIMSVNRPEYAIMGYGCYMYGFIVVGLFTSYDPRRVMDSLRRTQSEILVVDNLARIRSFEKQLFENDQIKEIIVMDEVQDGEHSKIRSFSSILKTMNKANIRPRPTIDPNSISTFLLTSGTTGYYDDAIKTRETIDEAGWLHTGDVGEWTANGTLRLIDRSKHIFKLNQGEYIAPEHLEDIYLHSRWISQIFIDGCSTEATVVAIVVPDEEYNDEERQTKNLTSILRPYKHHKYNVASTTTIKQLRSFHQNP
ncbi:unnamed protein product [Rotaria sp. Silwood1]|nr:unnamed protein product [Rotaria sp. Silwood1]